MEVTGGVDAPTVPACAKFLRIQGEWGRRSEKPEPSDEGGEVKEMTSEEEGRTRPCRTLWTTEMDRILF